MAADRASTDSLCGPLVSSVLAFVARCRRVARGTLFRSRPHDSMALGAAVWSGTGPPSAQPSETNQQVVACGRDLCKSERPLVLSVSSDRFSHCSVAAGRPAATDHTRRDAGQLV